MRRNLMSCLSFKHRIGWIAYRLTHWRKMKDLRAKVDHAILYGTSDTEPKGLTRAEEEERETTKKMNEAMEAFNIEKEKPVDANGCGYCKGKSEVTFVYFPSLTDMGIQSPALYCPMCGRKMPEEE